MSDRLRRLLHLEWLHRPAGISTAQLLLGVLVPGVALWVSGRRMLAWIFIAVYGIAFVVLAVWFGHTVSRLAYGTLISIHAAGIFFLLNRSLCGHYEFPVRFGVCVLSLLLLWLAAYRPAMMFVQSRWFYPVEVHGRVVVMRPATSTERLRAGQWVLFRLDDAVRREARGMGVVVRDGLGFGPILGQPGDSLRFTTNSVVINGKPLPRRHLMPVGGEWMMPSNQWFAWPEFDVSNGGASPAVIADQLVELGLVRADEIVGAPYRRWFWRQQLP
ncbi:MAG TPA: hypothetical protein VEH04_02300 [Verrucomicrobiae bacterium]|nr:hypothetical protein [Verrucomicrobiae bacterium]